MNKPLLATYFRFVVDLSALSKCLDKKVACVILDKSLQQVLSIGINGGPRGSEINCLCKTDTKYSCIHSEANALIKLNTYRENKILICTLAPCTQCASMIVNEPGGFDTVLYAFSWKEQCAIDVLKNAGIKVGKLLSTGDVQWQ